MKFNYFHWSNELTLERPEITEFQRETGVAAAGDGNGHEMLEEHEMSIHD